MTHARPKIAVASILVVVAVGYLCWAGARKGWVYYIDVDTFLADAKYHDQRVRLAGKVAEDGVESHPGLMTARFDLLGAEQRVAVVYEGVVPDLFKPGCNVVLEGNRDADGVFQADTMLTKCASKYQAEEHAKRLEAGS